MGEFFNLDSGIMHGISKIVDMALLSILWLICSIPIITIGGSTAALYYTSVKVIRRDRGYVAREFFHSFKSNFLQGTVFSIILVIVFFSFDFNITFATKMEDKTMGTVLLYLYYCMLFVIFIINIYIYPVLSRFEMKIREIVKFSAIISIKHLPKTLVMAVILFILSIVLQYMPFIIFIIPAFCCLTISYFMEKILILYTPKEDGEDKWYLEEQ